MRNWWVKELRWIFACRMAKKLKGRKFERKIPIQKGANVEERVFLETIADEKGKI